LERAIRRKEENTIYSSIYALLRVSRNLSNIILTTNIKISQKREILADIAKYCPVVEKIINCLLKDPSKQELGLEFAKNVYLIGCLSIFNTDFGKKAIRFFRRNLDLLAYFVDILIEVGCVDLAYDALLLLLKERYNLVSVLINLAITSYLLGYPEKALGYIKIYEDLTSRKSRLKLSLQIALGETI